MVKHGTPFADFSRGIIARRNTRPSELMELGEVFQNNAEGWQDQPASPMDFLGGGRSSSSDGESDDDDSLGFPVIEAHRLPPLYFHAGSMEADTASGGGNRRISDAIAAALSVSSNGATGLVDAPPGVLLPLPLPSTSGAQVNLEPRPIAPWGVRRVVTNRAMAPGPVATAAASRATAVFQQDFLAKGNVDDTENIDESIFFDDDMHDEDWSAAFDPLPLRESLAPRQPETSATSPVSATMPIGASGTRHATVGANAPNKRHQEQQQQRPQCNDTTDDDDDCVDDSSSTLDDLTCSDNKCNDSLIASLVGLSQSAASLTSNRKGKRWEAFFAELLEFRKKFGHCSVPFHDDPSNTHRDLAQWIKRQRYHYKLKSQGHARSSISADRIALLESVPGFVWNSHCAAWDAKYDELREFARDHGHCNVPRNNRENPQLSTWIKRQRRLYSKANKTSKTEKGRAELDELTLERLAKLNAAGFVWNVRQYQAQEKKRQLYEKYADLL